MAIEISNDGEELKIKDSNFKTMIKESYHIYFAGEFKVSGTGGIIQL